MKRSNQREDGRGSTGEAAPGPAAPQRAATTLRDLLRDQLRDAYSVERQLIPALEELESLAVSKPLKRLLRDHAAETRRQKARLERIAEARGWELGGDKSKAMQGLIEGGHAHIAEIEASPARDFLVVAHTLRVERYEQAAYEACAALAQQLGYAEDAALLKDSGAEERETRAALARLAATEILGRIPPG